MHAPGAAGAFRAVRAAAVRPMVVVADYANRVWCKAASDDLFFLAGGVAFDILLAGVPFFMLLASGLQQPLGLPLLPPPAPLRS